MKMSEISLLEWQEQFGKEESCVEKLISIRRPEGFYCPECAGRDYTFIRTRQIYQCSHCRHQTSVTAGTIFHSSKIPLVKWFRAIYLMASDKGGISALRLSKYIHVSWLTAHRILRKIRKVMAHRDSTYRLKNLIELDDALVGGKKTGKRGRGAEGKKPILVAVEKHDKHAGFMAAETLDAITKEGVSKFLHRHVKAGQKVRTDALAALNAVSEEHEHQKRVTPPEEASIWLPLVHIVIGNLKTFINGTYHGVSHAYLHEYISEFCYRFNRRFREFQLPFRLLNACLAHVPLTAENY